MSAVDEARKVEVGLQAKLGELRRKEADINDERRRLSYSANTGDRVARKALEDATTKAATLALEIENCEFAIAESNNHTVRAKAEEAAEAERAKARDVQAILATAALRAPRMSGAAARLCDEILAFKDECRAMRLLGAPVTAQRLIELALTRSIGSILREAGLDFDLVPPLQRHEVEGLAAGYLSPVRAWIDKILSPSKAEAA
jgi:hypothetical protein